jgi:Mrp family chromosome partitioning ATPase
MNHLRKPEVMDPDSTIPPDEVQFKPNGPSVTDTGKNKIVRLVKDVVVNFDHKGDIDDNIVGPRFYNYFNYSLLPQEQPGVKMTLGITSPNPKEGKTLVASNLAVAIAMSYQRKTVLVDLNTHHPRIHEVFGVPMKPGLLEAFNNVAIHVSATKIEDLFVLSAGGRMARPLGLNQLPFFRDVVYSLVQEFDFVIVDMPSMNVPDLPILFASQLNGLLIVVNIGKTKRAEVDRMFRLLKEGQVFGFVLNRYKDDTSPAKKMK